jgi:hypothetical protein
MYANLRFPSTYNTYISKKVLNFSIRKYDKPEQAFSLYDQINGLMAL